MFMVPEGVNPALLEVSGLFADARSVTAEIWPKVAFVIHSLLQRSARDPECKTPLHYVNLNARKLQEMISTPKGVRPLFVESSCGAARTRAKINKSRPDPVL